MVRNDAASTILSLAKLTCMQLPGGAGLHLEGTLAQCCSQSSGFAALILTAWL